MSSFLCKPLVTELQVQHAECFAKTYGLLWDYKFAVPEIFERHCLSHWGWKSGPDTDSWVSSAHTKAAPNLSWKNIFVKIWKDKHSFFKKNATTLTSSVPTFLKLEKLLGHLLQWFSAPSSPPSLPHSQVPCVFRGLSATSFLLLSMFPTKEL